MQRFCRNSLLRLEHLCIVLKRCLTFELEYTKRQRERERIVLFSLAVAPTEGGIAHMIVQFAHHFSSRERQRQRDTETERD